MGDARPLRILALDGGGVRGLSEVLILKNLFQRVDFEENTGRRSAHLPEPWNYFDPICGTSTGGLLALMLGRLRMVCFLSSFGTRLTCYANGSLWKPVRRHI